MREREPLILGHVFLQQNLDPASTGQPAPSAAGGQCCGSVPGLCVKSPVLLTSEEQCAKTRRAASGAHNSLVLSAGEHGEGLLPLACCSTARADSKTPAVEAKILMFPLD